MIRSALLFLVFCTGASQLLAQQQQVHGWIQAGAEFDLTKDLELQVSLMARPEIYPDYTLTQYNTEIGLAYAWNKHWKAGLEGRFGLDEGFPESRLAASVRYRDGLGPWELQWRMKAQIQWTQFELPEKELRNRFLLGYEINKHLMPYLAAEYFLTADHAETSFREYRYMAGAEYELNKKQDLELTYIYSNAWNTGNQNIRHIASLSWKYNW